MIGFLKYLWQCLRLVLRSKFKYMLIFFALWLYRIDFMPDAGGGLAKAVQIVCLLGLLFQMRKYRSNIIGYSYSHTTMSIKSCLVLYTYAMLSTLWAYMPSMAFFMSFQNVVMITLMVWYFSMFRDLRSMERGFVVFALSSVLFEWIVIRIFQPSLMVHFLASGSSAALCFVYCAAEWMKAKEKSRKTFLKYSMLLAFVLMVTSTSMGATSAAIIGFALACLLAGRATWACAIFFVGIVLFFNQDKIDDIILAINPGKTMESIKTGNGRDEIWAALLENAKQRPVFGWGYACIERTAQDVISGQLLSDAHNNYIGVYGSLGIVGLVLFVWHLVVSLFTSFANNMRHGYLGVFTALVTAAVNGYSYGFLSGKGCSITVIYFALVVLTMFYRRVPYQIVAKTNEQGIK